MRAYIKLWGSEYVTSSVDWYRNGELSHVTFRDENDKFYVISNMHSGITREAESNRNSDEPIHAKLEEIVFWTKK